jgi:hypothetical protein
MKGWLLPERLASYNSAMCRLNNALAAVPSQRKPYRDISHLLVVLQHATSPMTIREITYFLTLLEPNKKVRMDVLYNRVKRCLKYLSDQRSVTRRPLPVRDKRASGWLLAERASALGQAGQNAEDRQPTFVKPEATNLSRTRAERAAP